MFRVPGCQHAEDPRASKDESFSEKPYYIKTNFDPCSGGTFNPITASYIPSVFEPVSYQSQFPDSVWQIEHWDIMDSIFGGEVKSKNIKEYSFEATNNHLILFPNPTGSSFSINLPKLDTPWFIKIVHYTGQVIYYNSGFNDDTFSFDLSSYKSGIYFVHLKSQQTDRWLKVVKQ